MRLFEGVDRTTLWLYLLLVAAGCLSIFSASYSAGDPAPFALSHFYMKQIVWASLSFAAALVLLLLDARVYHVLAYPAYVAGLLLLLLTFFAGSEINGAKAWLVLGPVSLQPVEFVKIATALVLARVMSEYTFSISRPGHLARVALVICLPLAIVVLQNDTGSGIVFGAFLFVLYREGLNRWLCIPVLLIVALFIFSFLLTPFVLLVLLVLICICSEAMMNGGWRSRVVFLAAVALATGLVWCVAAFCAPGWLDLYGALLIASAGGVLCAAVYAYRANLRNIYLMLVLFVGSVLFLPTTDYLFGKLNDYQQLRILNFLGLYDDPFGNGYNANQARIAIGSGGLLGKGFLQGTQIRYGFVPERHTDFIFCTVGEEWGFVGSVVVLGLFAALILRLMRMGERQEEPFGRIYCYSVAAILLFHVLVNVGMTVGLMPVMGIPLPFMSYGGSSLLAFTVLVFIAVRLDASTRQFSSW